MGKRPVTRRKPDEALEMKLCPLCPWNQVLAVDAGGRRARLGCRLFFLGWRHVVQVWVNMEDVLDREACVLACRPRALSVLSFYSKLCPGRPVSEGASWNASGQEARARKIECNIQIPVLIFFWVFQLVHCGTHLILVVVPFFWRPFLFVYFRK